MAILWTMMCTNGNNIDSNGTCLRDIRAREVWSLYIIVLVAIQSNYFWLSRRGRISVKETCDSHKRLPGGIDNNDIQHVVDGSFKPYGNFLRNKLALNAHSNNFAWPRAVATNYMQSKIQMCPDYTLMWLLYIPQFGKATSSNFGTVVFNP